jgi:CSLREA domain-containing protein
MGRVLAGIVVALALIAAPAQAAVVQVTTTGDDLTSGDDTCSLREAINTLEGSPNLDCGPGGGGGTIQLGAGHYVLSLPQGGNNDANHTGDLDLLGSIVIQGVGAGSTTIDAQHIDRVIDVQPSATAVIVGVTVTGGRASAGAAVAPNTPGTGADGNDGAPGGGIRSRGTLTVSSSVVTDNQSGDGSDGGNGTGAAAVGAGNGGNGTGGAGGDGGNGGGIYTTGSLTLTASAVTNNVTGHGGEGGNGIGAAGGGAGGTATGGAGGNGTGGPGGFGGYGGGLESQGGTTTITDSAIAVNATGAGAAGGVGLGGTGGSGGMTPGTGGHGGTGTSNDGGASGGAGGMLVGGPLDMNRSAVYGNSTGAGGLGGTAAGGAGGLDNSAGAGGAGGTATAGDGGDAGDAAGVYAINAIDTITNTTIDSNTGGTGGAGGTGLGGNGGNGTAAPGGNGATGAGGNGGNSRGGGLVTEGALNHVTITANSGGAVGVAGTGTGGSKGTGSPVGSDASGTNGAAGVPMGAGGIKAFVTPSLRNSIVASNSGLNCFGTVADGGHDISFGDATCPGSNVDPKLGALADNGGPTRTRAIAADSPARDAVPAAGAGCPGTDQRGIARPQGAACDAGAFELAQEAPGPGVGGQPPGDSVAPLFASVSLSPSTFVVDRKAQAEVAVSARKHRKGTRFRYSLSEAARVVFTVEKRKVRRCGKRKRKRCVRYVRTGRFAHASARGANVKRFSGRIGRRSLKPGRYRVALVASDAAGNKSKPKRLNFRVVRR